MYAYHSSKLAMHVRAGSTRASELHTAGGFGLRQRRVINAPISIALRSWRSSRCVLCTTDLDLVSVSTLLQNEEVSLGV